MKSFKEYLNEAKSGTMELPTTQAKKLKPKIEKDGHEVTKADEEGLVVKTDNMEKLHRLLLDNGWDEEEIEALH